MLSDVCPHCGAEKTISTLGQEMSPRIEFRCGTIGWIYRVGAFNPIESVNYHRAVGCWEYEAKEYRDRLRKLRDLVSAFMFPEDAEAFLAKAKPIVNAEFLSD